jgi:hypothetical protein
MNASSSARQSITIVCRYLDHEEDSSNASLDLTAEISGAGVRGGRVGLLNGRQQLADGASENLTLHRLIQG